MLSRRLMLLTMLALAAALPPAAQAKLPAPKTKKVVFGKSIAGVKLGMSLDAAKAAWGPGPVCTESSGATVTTNQCSWNDKNGSVALTATNGKITSLSVNAPVTDPLRAKMRLTGPITAYRTAKGIGIGSTLKTLRKAYPKTKDGAADTLVIFSGKITTSFVAYKDKVAKIVINAAPVT